MRILFHDRTNSFDQGTSQTPERRGDAASPAVDFGLAQRVPTGVARGAESKTGLSARGLW